MNPLYPLYSLTRMIGGVVGVRNTQAPPPDPHPWNDLQRYYTDGFIEGAFAATPALGSLQRIVAELKAGNLKADFQWKQKYPHTQDLRPNAAEYDEAVLDVLFESDIPGLLKRATGADLRLAHVQIRTVFPGASYMSWHRDTHVYDGKVAGNIPPVQKLIYYPTSGGASTPQLHVLPGSHRRLMPDRKRDLRQVKETPRATVASSDDRFLLFDTSLLHAVAPETDPRGSLRLIYAFAHDFQLEPYHGSRAVQERYLARLVSR